MPDHQSKFAIRRGFRPLPESLLVFPRTCYASSGERAVMVRSPWRTHYATSSPLNCIGSGLLHHPVYYQRGNGNLHFAEARVSQVEAELRLILVGAKVSQLEALLSHLESELTDVRTQGDILMRPSNWALRTAP